MNVLFTLLSLIASICLFIWCILFQPVSFHTPDGWYVNGIRKDGVFWFIHKPNGHPDNDGTYGKPDDSSDDFRFLKGKIYCTGGTYPIVLNESVVGCQR